MAAKRKIVLQGTPIYNERGAAGEEIWPGMLVQGVTTIMKQSSAAAAAARTFALEREAMGKGVDNTFQGSATPYGSASSPAGSAAYAIGDQVKVGSFAPGDVISAYVPSGQDIAEGAFVQADGAGGLVAYSSGVRLGRAMEAIDTSAGAGLGKVEIY